MSTREVDERGERLVSAVVAIGRCAWCDGPMPIRALGRPPKFCQVSCRKALHAAEQRVATAKRSLAAAEAELKAARLYLAGRSSGAPLWMGMSP